MGAMADRLAALSVDQVIPDGCRVCLVYEGKMPDWDAEDADALRERVESKLGYKAIAVLIKGTGVSADAIRVHRKHSGG